MYLKIEIEDTESITYSLPKSVITIGASSENNVIINVNSVSRKHLKLIKDGQNWFVEDQGSTNGSYLNSRKLSAGSKEMLRLNEFVRLGDKVFLMLVSSAEKPAAISNFKINPPKVEDPNDKTRVISLAKIKEAAEMEKRRKELLAEKKMRNKKNSSVKKLAFLFASILCLVLFKTFI